MIAARFFTLAFLLGAASWCMSSSAPAQQPDTLSDRESRHLSPEWLMVLPHLPNPLTATPDSLLSAADVLRARRLPEDALEYYQAALQRGASPSTVLNRIGVTELELRRPTAALMALRHAVAIDKKSAESWNNLGAAEYMVGNYQGAIGDYRRAVKLDRKAPVFHSNLGTALFERKDFEGARSQFATALKLDPLIFQRSGWAGIQAHVMSAQDRGRFCFEMAKLAARSRDDDSVLLWLARAGEAGFDLKTEVGQSRELATYVHDPRILVLVANEKSMHARQLASAPIPALPAGPGSPD